MLLERLIYASRKAPDVDVPALVAQAARCNEAAGITGALATLEGDFFQYLEGTTVALDALLVKLLADPRHSELKVLERRAIPRRMFGDWRMAHLQWNADTQAIFRSFSPDSRVTCGTSIPAPVPRCSAPGWHCSKAVVRRSRR